jgi:hypothetical protein
MATQPVIHILLDQGTFWQGFHITDTASLLSRRLHACFGRRLRHIQQIHIYLNISASCLPDCRASEAQAGPRVPLHTTRCTNAYADYIVLQFCHPVQ